MAKKKMCKEDGKAAKKLAGKPKYECKSCGAEAEKEKHLCKPRKI